MASLASTSRPMVYRSCAFLRNAASTDTKVLRKTALSQIAPNIYRRRSDVRWHLRLLTRGLPAHIRSDNGPEFTSEFIRGWLKKIGVETLFIMPGSPWEDGYNESFNGKLRDEILNRGIFNTLLEARVLIDRWRIEYNTIRPHSSLGNRPPALETYSQKQIGIAMPNVSS